MWNNLEEKFLNQTLININLLIINENREINHKILYYTNYQ